MIRLAKSSTSLMPSLSGQNQMIGYGQANALPSEWLTDTFGPGYPVQPLYQPADERRIPREIDYPIAVNATLQPRIGYGLLPFSVIKSAYDNITEVNLPLRIVVRELLGFKPRFVDDNDNEIFDHPYRWLIESPDRELPHDVWLTRFLKSALVYDAGTFHIQTAHGDLQALDYIDGSTLMLIINEDGRLPRPDEISRDESVQSRYIEKATAWTSSGKPLPNTTPAFAQVIHGVPFAWWDQDQIYYKPNSRSIDTPYGESFIERSFTWINIVANITGFELAHYRTGNMPEGWAESPADWPPERINLWENTFNARMTSGPAERMRVRFLPTGFKYHETKKPQFPKELYDEARSNIALSLGLPASELGKVPGQGLGGKGFGEAMESSLFRNALIPFKTYVEDAFNSVLKRFGIDDVYYELALPTTDTDPEKQKESIQGLFAAGILTLNQALSQLGQDPVQGGDVHIIVSGANIVVLEDILKNRQNGGANPGDLAPQNQADIQQSNQLLSDAARNGTMSTTAYSIPSSTQPISQKKSKSEAQYTDVAADMSKRCAVCVHFQRGNACEIVEGVILSGGTCKYFEAKPPDQSDPTTAPSQPTESPDRTTILDKHCGVCIEDDEYFGAPISREVSMQLPIDHHANGIDIVASVPDDLPPKPFLWKPEGEERPDLQEFIGGPQYVREEAAYLLDRSLGFMLVPVAYVAQANDEEGAAVYYIEGMQPALEPDQYGAEWIEKAAVLDYIMSQQDRGDRHNYSTNPDDPTRMILYDNGLSFPKDESLYCRSPFCELMVGKPLQPSTIAALNLCKRDASAWRDILALVGRDATAKASVCLQRLLDNKMLTHYTPESVMVSTNGSGGL